MVLGANITFKAELFTSYGTPPSGTFRFRWRDNAIPPHFSEVSCRGHCYFNILLLLSLSLSIYLYIYIYIQNLLYMDHSSLEEIHLPLHKYTYNVVYQMKLILCIFGLITGSKK